MERAVGAFFEAFGAAFERQNAAEISNYFAYPALAATEVDQVMLTPILSRSEWIHQIEQLIQMYKRIDLRKARILEISVRPFSSRLAHAVVHWALHDGSGARLYDFDAVYTVGRFGEEWKVIGICHNELPRYWACLEARRNRPQ